MASLTGYSQRSPVYNLIDYYSKAGYWDNSYNSTLWNIASQLVDDTKYRGKVRINQAPSQEYINLYVFSKDPDGVFPKCNCSYLGQGNVIVCDKKAIEYFSSLIFLKPESNVLTVSDSVAAYLPVGDDISFLTNAYTFYFMIAYIMGHEIGHLVLKHPVASYFAHTGVAGTITYNSMVNQNELDADIFSVNKLGNLKQFNLFYAWNGYNNMISHLYPQVYRDWCENQRISPIRVPSSKTMHPPWLYRLVKMAKVFFNEYPEIQDGSGYYDSIENKIILQQATPAQAAECRYTLPTPDLDSVFQKLSIETDDLSYLYMRCKIFLQTGNWNLLDRYMQRAKTLISDNADNYVAFMSNFNYYEGLFYFNKGDYQKVLSYWNSVDVNLLDDDRTFLQYRSIIYLKSRRIDDALRDLQQQLTHNPTSSSGWLLFSLAQGLKKNKTKEFQAFTISQVLDPSETEVSVLRYKTSLPPDLVDSCRRRFSNKNIQPYLKNKDLQDVLYQISGTYYANKQPDKAIGIIRQLLKNVDKTDVTRLGELANFEGMCYRQKKEYNAAKDAYKEALGYRQSVFEGSATTLSDFYVGQTLYNLGNLASEEKDTASAISYYHEAIKHYHFTEDMVDMWGEEYKVFYSVMTLEFLFKGYDAGYQDCQLLDSLAARLSLSNPKAVSLNQIAIKLAFGYLKRMIQNGLELNENMRAYLTRVKNRVSANPSATEDTRGTINNFCDTMNLYFTDKETRFYINGLDFIEEAKETGKAHQYLYLAFIQLDSALTVCTDDRFATIISKLDQTYNDLVERIPLSDDSLFHLDTVERRQLLNAKIHHSKEVYTAVVDSLLSSRCNEMAFIVLKKGTVEQALKYAEEALSYKPNDQTAQSLIFISSPIDSQEKGIAMMTRPMARQCMGLIEAVPLAIQKLLPLTNASRLIKDKFP